VSPVTSTPGTAPFLMLLEVSEFFAACWLA
jgi:hypothetical protein